MLALHWPGDLGHRNGRDSADTRGGAEGGVRESVEFTVEGLPGTKGSHTAYRRGNRVVLVNACKHEKSWAALVSEAANVAMGKDLLPAFVKCPVSLVVTFRLPRPGKFVQVDLRHHKRKNGDLSKLVRSLEDALIGIVVQDDSQFDIEFAQKQYVSDGNELGATVRVQRAPIEVKWEKTA